MKNSTEVVELNINSRELLHALTLIGRVIPNNPIVTVLENVKIEFSGTEAKFTADNLKQNITVTVPCGTFGDSGQFLAPYKKLYELVKTFPDSALSIVHTETPESCSIVINADGKKFKLTSEPIKDFPQAKVFTGNQITLPAKQIKEAINLCLVTVCPVQLRPDMCGIFFNTEAGEIVSTNGMNLTRYELGTPIDVKPFIISSEFATMIKDLIDHNQEDVVLEVSDRAARFTADDQVITTTLIDDRYPDYRNAIPETCQMEAVIDLDEWNTLLKRSILFSSGKVGLVKSRFQNGVLTAISEDLDYGREADQDMKYDGDIDIEIGVSGKSLTSIFKLVTGSATIGLIAPNRPILIFPEKTFAKRLTILSMPLMLN